MTCGAVRKFGFFHPPCLSFPKCKPVSPAFPAWFKKTTGMLGVGMAAPSSPTTTTMLFHRSLFPITRIPSQNKPGAAE